MNSGDRFSEALRLLAKLAEFPVKEKVWLSASQTASRNTQTLASIARTDEASPPPPVSLTQLGRRAQHEPVRSRGAFLPVPRLLAPEAAPIPIKEIRRPPQSRECPQAYAPPLPLSVAETIR